MREDAGLTQEELAEQADIGLRSLQRYEAGNRKITLDVFWRMVTICKFTHLVPMLRKVLGPVSKQPKKKGKRKNASRSAKRKHSGL
jgi:transcriptional regulator with XRE-family HTH domain